MVTVIKKVAATMQSVGKRRTNNSGLNMTGFAGLWTFPVDLGGLKGETECLSTQEIRPTRPWRDSDCFFPSFHFGSFF